MSANERLDLDQLNRDFTDAVCSMRVPFNRLVADALARIPRLIAAVRERDAEIAELRKRPTLEEVVDAIGGAGYSTVVPAENVLSGARQRMRDLYAEKARAEAPK